MIEIRNYTHDELAEILGTNDNQGIVRKLDSWGIVHDPAKGRGNRLTINITGITNPFKVFALTELGVSPQTDFIKLRNFLYCFLNDDEFAAMPDEVKEQRMRFEGMAVSRQTIATYTRRLEALGFVAHDPKNCIYYFAYKGTQRIVERAEYLEAWHQYWADRETMDSGYAIYRMRLNYGGVARKQPKPEYNGIYAQAIATLNSLVQQSIEQEIEAQRQN